MGPKIIVFLCFTVALRSGYCELKSSGDDERARLPEFLTELDLASLEASQEDIEAIKTVVKRLAPEKNGVMGQPGVDFPALTTIPTTSFSCRGLKGGYYADLETNCQVFHICDNGRKISFLCPNGTIFQQSQLICDWWFKVDCSKSTELYEQSAEQLAEDERKRLDAKRINSEFHRPNSESENNNGQNYYQSQNSNYDGRQNGRTNPYGDASGKNQIPGSPGQKGQNSDSKTSSRDYDPNQIYASNGVTSSRFNQINDLADGNTLKSSRDGGQNANNYKTRQQSAVQSPGKLASERGNYRVIDRQQNQLVDTANEEAKRQFNYEPRGTSKFSGLNRNNNKNHQQQQQQQQLVKPSQQSGDYTLTNRNAGRDSERRNFGESSSIGSRIFDYEQSSNRVTPSYTETTTFRTSTPSPIREYQQLAESAAFASNRGNRFNEAYSSSQFNSYYNNVNANGNSNSSETRVQQKTTEKPRYKPITPTPGPDRIGASALRVRVGQPAAASPSSTPRPPYQPRSSNRNFDYVTTTRTPTTPDIVNQTDTIDNAGDNRGKTSSYNDDSDYGTTTAYPTNQEPRVTTDTFNVDSSTEDYTGNSVTPGAEQTIATNADFFENTTPTIISSGTYVNAKAYTSNRAQTVSYRTTESPSGSEAFRSYSKSQDNGQNSLVAADLTKESNVRRSDASSAYVTSPASHSDVSTGSNSVKSQENADQQSRGLSKSSPKTQSVSYGQWQNSISTSTEKSSRFSATTGLAPSGLTGKTLSPYDTSITYQQGKVMSTLGPYVPFTKNYAYSTTTTSTTVKPPVYTATVPTYSSTSTIYRSSSVKSLAGKFKPPAGRPTSRLPSGSAAYLPEKKSDASTYFSKKHSLIDRPSNEREHAMSMLQSLQGLEGSVPSILEISNGSRVGLNVPTSSGPSTLHSLALYFATAADDFGSTAETRTDSAADSESTEVLAPEKSTSTEGDASVELPKSILTQHTINSYAELFNLNNALEGNSSTKTVIDDGLDGSGEDTDDLDIQQSQGPVDGARKSNGTRLRELAQVFTHALSAYLQDPDTFKKILTEIRPTEPPTNPENEEKFSATTTLAPTTLDDYPSVTKEKDEVLDFSDDSAPLRGRRPTIYPITTTDRPITTDRYDQRDYHTTTGNAYTTDYENSNESNEENNFAFQVNNAFGTAGKNGVEPSSSGIGDVFYPEEVSGPSGTTALDASTNYDPLNDYTDNYFPSDDNNSNNKLGGFQNNTRSASTYQPYGKNVKPFDATPISDNYVSSSTPSTYVGSFQPQAPRLVGSGSIQRHGKVPDKLDASANSGRSGPTRNSGNSITRIEEKNPPRSTTEPFRIRYYDPTTPSPRASDRESLVTAGSVYSKYRETSNDFTTYDGTTSKPDHSTSVLTPRTNDPISRQNYNDDDSSRSTNQDGGKTTTANEEGYDRRLNDHWTSSPTVTQLWESTVFVDPERINQGLVSNPARDSTLEISTPDYSEVAEGPRSAGINKSNDNPNRENLVTDATSSGLSSRNTNNLDYPSSPWKWSTDSRIDNNEDDSPTAFTLLPQTTYVASERDAATVTLSPIYTTRSSITTTITSSVTSTTNSARPSARLNSPLPQIQRNVSTRPKNGIAANDKDNEIVRAQEMFGKLNTSSSDTLMRVMKQADRNATVRQLVLLLINHCNGPMNKTMEEEKQQLLDALLRMPVNEFTSEESRELVAGINKLKLPIGKNDFAKESSTKTSTTTSTTEEPAITTFRSKKGRRIKNENSRSSDATKENDDVAAVGSGTESNALASEDTSTSDARALELLRSLYTIAAKWG